MPTVQIDEVREEEEKPLWLRRDDSYQVLHEDVYNEGVA